jgi:DNA-binding XRE family transcriptional regulator
MESSELLKELRYTNNLTQTQLADILKCKQQTICMVETNKRNMPASLKLAILKHFGIDFDEVINV